MKNATYTRNLLSVVGCIAFGLATSPLTAAPVIYEPFADANASLAGNATGTGLSGNWTATAAWDVLPGSLASWGVLPTSGSHARADTGGAASAVVGAGVLSTPGLLNHGATLWFSMIYTTTPVVSGNPDAGFALGTAGLSGVNNIPMTGSGSGLGFSIKNGVMSASTWSGGGNGRATDVASSEPVSGSTTYLIVGQIIWGADSGAPDTINLYRPGTGLALGPIVATRTAVLDQSAFDTISYAQKNDSNPAFFDEIRFGATYLDVIGAAPTAAYWDIDDVVVGSGSDDSPDGTWDAANTFWNPVADGTGTSASWTANQAAVFAAGSDATGNYDVTVDGTQVIGGLTFEEGTVTLSGGTALDLIAAGGAFDVRDPAKTVTVSTPITQSSGSGVLYKEGGGTLVLSGANTYDSPTIMNGGTLVLQGDNSGATGTMTLNGGITHFDSILAIPGAGRSVTANAVAMFGALSNADIATGLGRFVASSPGIIAADNNSGGAFNLNTGGLTAVYFGAVGNVNFTGALTPNGNYRLGGAGGTLTMANTNALTGAGKTLTVGGPGTVTLAASNNYTGTTTINSGATLSKLASNSSSATTVNGGGTFIVGHANSTGGAGVTLNGGGALIVASSAAFNIGANQIFFSSGASIRSDSATARSIAGRLNGNANNNIVLGNATNNGKLTFTVAASASSSDTLYICNSDVEFAAGFQSGNSVNKQGSATMTISGTALYTGNTTVTAGMLQIARLTSLYNNNPANWITTKLSAISGATLALNVGGTGEFGTTELATFLDGTHMGASTATTGLKTGSFLGLDTSNASGGAFTPSSAIPLFGAGNVVGLTKLGTGTLVLDHTQAYAGPTKVNSGILLVNGSLAGGLVTVSSGASLGGTGTIGGSTTIQAGGKLEFNISTAAGSHDKLDLAATKSLTFLGASTLTITFSGSPSAGDFTLVTAPAGFGASVAPATVVLPLGWTADSPRFDGNDLKINITSTGGDATPPAWASGWPKADTIGTTISTGFNVRAKTDEAGIAYYVVLASGATAPTSAQVKAGNDSTNAPALQSGNLVLTADTEANGLVTGLGSTTTYDVWFVAEDATSNLQASPATVSVTTLTPYEAWLADNSKTDTDANRKEFAFGTTNTGALVLDGAGTSIVTRGQAPIITTTEGSEFVKLTYARRKNSGFTFSAEYSDGLLTWLPSDDATLIYNPGAPAGETLADNGDEMEIVSINFPVFRDVGGGSYEKIEANFCRIAVATN